MLAGAQRPDRGVEHDVGAALDQADHTDLRIPHVLLAPPRPGRPPERLHVGLRVRQIEGGPVDRGQPPIAVERAPGVPIGHRRAHRREQLLHRLDAQPGAGLPDRRRRRHRPRRTPPPRARKPFGQQPGDLLVALPGEQAHRQHEVHHQTGPVEDGCAAPPDRSTASTESTSDDGNAVVNTPIATRSDRRSSDPHLTRTRHTKNNDRFDPKLPVLGLGPGRSATATPRGPSRTPRTARRSRR